MRKATPKQKEEFRKELKRIARSEKRKTESDLFKLLRDAMNALESDEPSEVRDVKTRIAQALANHPTESASARLAALCEESRAWHKTQGLPFESADETESALFHMLWGMHEDIQKDKVRTIQSQLAWLRDFIARWNAAEREDRIESEIARDARDSGVWFSTPFSVRKLGPNWNALQLAEGFYVAQFDTADESESDPIGPFETEDAARTECESLNKELAAEDSAYVATREGR